MPRCSNTPYKMIFSITWETVDISDIGQNVLFHVCRGLLYYIYNLTHKNNTSPKIILKTMCSPSVSTMLHDTNIKKKLSFCLCYGNQIFFF